MSGLRMGAALFKGYALVQALAIGAYLFVPLPEAALALWQAVVGWGAAAFIVIGMRRWRPEGALSWYLFAGGVALNTGGGIAEAILSRGRGEVVAPSLADAFWLGLYPGLILGMALLIRRRVLGRDWSALVDTTTITTGLGLLSWVFIIRPQVGDEDLGRLGRAVVMAYPVSDIVVLAMLVRLLLAGGTRSLAFRLMVVALLAFLASDVGWAALSALGAAPGPLLQRLLEASALVACALVGAAALHPSVRDVARAAPPRQTRLSPLMLAGLTCASLIAPGVLLAQALRRQVTDGVAIAIGSTGLFLLVVTRMAQLLRQVEAQARQLRELARIDELTGLPNRRAWTTNLPLALERARRDGAPLSVGLIDLDHFKRFNDTHGHPAGDRLLQEAATRWRGRLRVVDQLARYGGEEFIAFLPSADGPQASAVLARLREATPAGQTFSAGVATWDGHETSKELIARANRALYAAKGAGRNRTVLASEAPATAEAMPRSG